MLTWEPRRVRLNLARTAACGILAFVIAIVLQVIFLASFLPAVLANGTTAGADADWWVALTLAIARAVAAHVDRGDARRSRSRRSAATPRSRSRRCSRGWP